MFKKILMTSVILASSYSAVVIANPYLGASLGVTTNTAGQSFGNFRGMPAKIFGGYGVVNQNLYLAGELTGTAGTLSVSNKSSILKTSYGYGASFIPGVLLSDHTLAYARLGIVRTHFSSVDHTETGGEVGVGLQTSLAQSTDLRAEYNYAAYGKLSHTSVRSDNFNVGLVYKFD